MQGSRPRPYRVRVGLTAFEKAQWARVEQAPADDAWYTAKLLPGEMPTDVEDVFAAAGLALFPSDLRELAMDCSCPDWEVPCKHLVAVFYLLAESFDADPFAILALRGRSREDARSCWTTCGPTAAALPRRPTSTGRARAPCRWPTASTHSSLPRRSPPAYRPR
jgi:uncharacterized Zn finger protein